MIFASHGLAATTRGNWLEATYMTTEGQHLPFRSAQKHGSYTHTRARSTPSTIIDFPIAVFGPSQERAVLAQASSECHLPLCIMVPPATGAI
jgi:hypothetical protein